MVVFTRDRAHTVFQSSDLSTLLESDSSDEESQLLSLNSSERQHTSSSSSTGSSNTSFGAHTREDFIVEYESDSDQNFQNMSGLILDNTNSFACDIVLGDEVGNSLFSKATEGLPSGEKLGFNIEDARSFKEEVDNANATFVW